MTRRMARARTTRCTRSRRHSGFSLIELAVVLVIIGLLVGGGIAAVEVTRTQALRSEQEQQLERVRTALHGFAMSAGRLPCPDGPDDGGHEDFDTGDGECRDSLVSEDIARGRLPWEDLRLARRDAWGNPLLYAVTAEYADAPDGADPESTDQSSFILESDGNLAIDDDHDETISMTIAEKSPAVVVSFGPQGRQVWQDSGYTCPGDGVPARGFSRNETENCGGDRNRFVDAGFSRADSGSRFDDMLLWLSDPALKARMVQAGKLP